MSLTRITRPGSESRAPRASTWGRLWLCCMVASMTIVAGCGTEPGDEPEVELRLTYVEQAGAVPKEAVQRCPPAGDPTRDGHELCDLLLGLPPDVFKPVDSATACAEIWGGPQTARVVGRWKHGEVDAEFSRSNGCEIARWDSIEPLLMAAGLI